MSFTGTEGARLVQVHADRTEAYRNRFLLSHSHKICYAAVDKAACTTFKWWMADIEGIKDEVAAYLVRHKGTPKAAKGVHHAYGAVAPHLMPRSFAQIRAVFESGSYFCFAVVRNPFTRIFSAWSDKILKGRHDNTRYALSDAELFSQAPSSLEDVRRYFEDFVTYLHDRPGMVQANRHWMPQFLLLRPDLLGYDCIVPLEEPGKLQDALSRILGESYKNPLDGGGKKNTSLVTYHPDFITKRAADLIRLLYADDFAHFNYDPAHLPPGKVDLDPANVKHRLAQLTRQRIRYAYQKLGKLEQEKKELRNSPVRAFMLFLSAVGGLFRIPLERIRYAVLRRVK